MFLRFETYRLDLDSGMPEGLFTQAYVLCDSEHLQESQKSAIDEHLSWFRKNLPIPDRFSRKRNSSHKKTHGIAPFEDASVRKYSRNEAFMKRRTIQVRIFRGENKYVAECMDLPVVTQGDTLDEVTANIREAIGLHLEDEDLAELGIAPDPAIIATMELDAVA